LGFDLFFIAKGVCGLSVLLKCTFLHRFAKIAAIFTVFLFLPWDVFGRKHREIKVFCAIFVYLVILDKW